MKRIVLYLVLTAIGVGCARRPLGDPNAPLPPALLPPANAEHIQKAVFPGTAAEVHYDVRATYPADAVITHIQEHVRAAGFTPAAGDFFNPGMRTGLGWGGYLDSSQSEHAAVHQWSAWWLNKAGDHVGFMLWYRSEPYDGATLPVVPATEVLQVSGQFISRSEGDRLQSQLPKRTTGGGA